MQQQVDKESRQGAQWEREAQVKVQEAKSHAEKRNDRQP